MTIQEIRDCPREFLIPREVAEVLGTDPNTIRACARLCPERLGFKVALIGHRVKIPRRSFLRWLGDETEERA
jgi:hypothetical protein